MHPSPSEQDAIAAAYVRGEKVKIIEADFGVNLSYPTDLAKRRGLPLRQIRPKDVVSARLRPEQRAALTAYCSEARVKPETVIREALNAYLGLAR